jgi:ribosomal protein S27E
MENQTLEMTTPRDPVVGVVRLRFTVDCPSCDGQMLLTERGGAAHVRCPSCGHEQTYQDRTAAGVALAALRSIFNAG